MLIKRYIGLFLILILISGCQIDVEQPIISEGLLDLSGWNFETDGIISLKGDWEIYWEQFISPEDFNDRNFSEPAGYIYAPAKWDNYIFQGEKVGGAGYATYRLQIHLSDSDQVLAFKLLTFSTAYKLWINGKLSASVGSIGKSRENMVAEYRPRLVVFRPDSDQLDIVIQISNFHHRNGGIWDTIEFGTGQQIVNKRDRSIAIDLFILGSLFIMALYHFFLFFLRKSDRSLFYFGTICLLWSLNAFVSGEIISTAFFQEIDFSLFLRIEYLSILLSMPLFAFFLNSLFPDEFHRWVLYITVLFFIVVNLIIIVTEETVFTHVNTLAIVFMVIFSLYQLYVLGHALRNQQMGAGWLIVGTISLLITGINDFLYIHFIIFTGSFRSLGLLFYIFSQTYVLSCRFSKAFFRVEEISNELVEKNKFLAQLDQLKDEFLANTSHELQTPLNGITGLAESMLKGAAGKISKQVEKNLSIIISSSNRLSRLVDDILDFSRLENRDLQLNRKSVDLRSLSELIVNIFQEANNKKTLKISNRVPSGLPAVFADDDRLQQILYNLIGNAIKFTDDGEINVTAKVDKGKVRVFVSDTGIGISQEQQERIFSPFTQVEPNVKGTGLGLGITKHLVELHDGSLQLHSQIGIGSQFSFTLPVSAEKPAEKSTQTHLMLEQVQEPPDSISTLSVEDGRYRIFAVDDDSVNLRVIANYLSLAQMNVEFFSNGQDVLTAINNGDLPDLILLDVMMPEMSGYEVCHSLRKEYTTSELPIVMLTAKNQVSDLIEGLKHGASDYLTKPFSGEELLARIQTQLRIKDSYLALRENKILKGELDLRKQTEFNLRAMEQKLSGYLNTLEDPILVVDEFNKICFNNYAFESEFPELNTPLLEQDLSVFLTEDDLDQWNNKEKIPSDSQGTTGHFRFLPFKFKANDSKNSIPTLLVANLELEDERYYIFLIRYTSFDKNRAIFGNSILEAVNAVSNNNKKLRALEESINELTPTLLLEHPNFIKDLRKIESDLTRLEYLLKNGKGRRKEDDRVLIVEMINLSLDLWTKTTQKTKSDLAKETGLWRIYVSKDGHERTQTLDRYMSLSTLPVYPRKKIILETVKFILNNCPDSSPEKEKLIKYTEEFS